MLKHLKKSAKAINLVIKKSKLMKDKRESKNLKIIKVEFEYGDCGWGKLRNVVLENTFITLNNSNTESNDENDRTITLRITKQYPDIKRLSGIPYNREDETIFSFIIGSKKGERGKFRPIDGFNLTEEQVKRLFGISE